MMKSRRRPQFEGLEGRSLLSGLTATLTESAPVASPGQPIVFTLQETNNSSQPMTVDQGPSLDGFEVQQAGRTIWQSNAGIQPMFVTAQTLQPGQSLTLSTTWNGKAQDGSTPADGTYTIVNQMAPQATTTVKVASSTTASTRSSSTISITEPISPIVSLAPTQPPKANSIPTGFATTAQPGGLSSIALSVTSDRLRYPKGHRVLLTATLKNEGTSVVTLPINSSEDFAVKAGLRTIWQDNRVVSGLGSVTIQPGQTIEYTASWNGRSHPRGLPVRPGTYTVDASAEGFTGSSIFFIGGRLHRRA